MTHAIDIVLVGGFNPLERESSPSRGEHKKYLKPPPSIYARAVAVHLFIIYSCLKLVVEPTEEKTNNVTKVKFHDPPARRTGAMFDAEKV